MTHTSHVQPAPQTNQPSNLSRLVSETLALYQRSLIRLTRRPIGLYFSLVQPVVWLLLFGQIFNRITRFPGAAGAFGNTSYFQFFAPAVILQTLLFGSGQSGIGIITDIDSGYLNKLLVTPIHRIAIFLGRIMADLSRMLLQALLILLLTFIVGQFQAVKVSFAYGLPGILGALGIALMFGLALSGLSVFIALRTKNTETTFLISNFLTLPLLFTSSAQLPLQLLPTWLQHVAQFNPVTYAVEAIRILLNGPAAVPNVQPLVTVLEATLILLVLCSITVTLAVRSFSGSVGK